MGLRRLAPLAVLTAVVASCGESNDVVYTDDVVQPPGVAITVPPATTVVEVATGPVVIERIWSPENGIAELLGTGATAADPVTVDDATAEVAGFEVDGDGSFTLRVRIAEEGAHTVCVRDECGRVFVTTQ